MMTDRGRGGASTASQYATALGLSVALPFLALIGAAGGVWYLLNLSLPLTQSWEIFFAGVIGGAILIALVLWLMWSRYRTGLRQQVVLMAEICRAISEGAPQTRVPVFGEDEFAMLAAGINAVLDLRDGGGMAAPDAAALQTQIEKLLQEVSAVGEGDLSVQAEVTPDTLGVLADSFNYMIEELAKVVGGVQTTTQSVIVATRRILERSSELSRISDVQYSQIAQSSEQVEELAAFILSAARGATLSASAAQEALVSAREGQQAVSQTIEGMSHIRDNVQDTAKKIKRLGERSQEIGDIVRIIEDLAEQTNLLALNAAIQSAMAGENGRGFAVVADEIRLLAERSGEAAKRIVTLVKSIQGETQEAVVAMEESTQEVVAGSAMADNAGRALQAIYGAVDNQARMVEDIATAANERTATSEAVAMAMNRISEITRQTNATMQDTAANVSYLAELADQLRASVAAFRLPRQYQQAMGPARPQGNQRPMLGAPGMGGMPGGYGNGQGQGQYPARTGAIPALPPGYGPPPPSHSTQPGNGYGPPRQQPQTGQFPSFRPAPPFGPGPQQAPNGGRQGANPQQQPTAFDPWSSQQDGFDEQDGTMPRTGMPQTPER